MKLSMAFLWPGDSFPWIGRSFYGPYFFISVTGPGYMTWLLWESRYVRACRLFRCSYLFMVLPKAYSMTNGFRFFVNLQGGEEEFRGAVSHRWRNCGGPRRPPFTYSKPRCSAIFVLPADTGCAWPGRFLGEASSRRHPQVTLRRHNEARGTYRKSRKVRS